MNLSSVISQSFKLSRVLDVFGDVHGVLERRELSSELHPHRMFLPVDVDHKKNDEDKDEGDSSPDYDVDYDDVELERAEVHLVGEVVVQGRQNFVFHGRWLRGGVSVRRWFDVSVFGGNHLQEVGLGLWLKKIQRNY